MRNIAVGVLLALLLANAGWGQNVIIDQLTFKAPGVNPVSVVRAAATGTPGTVTLYYWVIARYPAGVSIQQGPGIARQTRGVAGLGANPVTVTWPAQAGATGYDVIRLLVPTWPSTNTCVNCVISSNQAGLTFSDVGGGVVNWPTAGTVQARSVVMTTYLNNRDDNYPYLVLPGELHMLAARSTNDYAYLVNIAGNMTGGAAQKTYGLGLQFTRPSTAVASGDSNDASIKATYSNYAKNDANFIIRGINSLATNRSPGTLGMVDNLISVANRSGATSPIVNGLTVNAENFGTNATQHSALDLSLKNEGAKATLEFGIRIRNLNNSLGTASDAVLLVPADALANAGWTHGIDFNGAKVAYDFRTHAGPVFFSGAGAPANGDCAASTLGSIYLNSAGGVNTSLYVCQAAGGWAAVTP